jgi:hypothetical protein
MASSRISEKREITLHAIPTHEIADTRILDILSDF